MGKDIKRAIKLIDLSKGQLKDGWISRGDLYSIFLDFYGFSESKFNSIIFLLKAKKIISEHNYLNGYHIDLSNFEKFKQKWRDKK